MTSADQQESLRAELRNVQEEAEQARAALDRTRRGLGGGGEGAIDAAEGASDLTAVEEQAALVYALEMRERGLRERLGLPPQ
jgi:hypothetical protein